MLTGKPTATRKDWLTIIVVCISVLLVILNVTRIFKIPLTIDECGTYEGITESYLDCIQLKVVSANNHILNTLLSKFFAGLFGDTPFALRFGNLLAQLMFLLFSYLICKRLFKNSTWLLCVFLILNLQPFMFEFWGLSRGYGLAIAFMTGSVYYLLRYVQDKKTWLLNMTLYFAILAVYSNFGLLDYYCGVALFIFLKFFIPGYDNGKNKSVLREIVSVLVASCVLFLLVAGPIKKLIADGQLYYGGANNIVRDTIMTVIRENFSIGGSSDTLLKFSAEVVLLSSITIGLYWCIRGIREKITGEALTGILLWILLAAPAIGIIAQHLLFKTLYPIDRTALYFIPLFLLSFTYWLYFITRRKAMTGTLSICALTLLMAYNFSSINVRTTRIWWFGANDLTVLNRIMRETKNKPHKNRICVYWIFAPSFNYYINTQDSAYFEKLVDVRDFHPMSDTTFDYYYVTPDYRNNIPKMYIIDTSFGGAFYLFKKNTIASQSK